MDSEKRTMQREVRDPEDLMEPHFVPIKVEPDLDRILEESVEDNFEATEDLKDIGIGECSMQSEVDDWGTLIEPLFVPIKAEPDFYRISEESVEENFEATEIPEGNFTTTNQEPSVPLVGPEESDAFSVSEIIRSSTRDRKQKLLLRNISDEEVFQDMNQEAHIEFSPVSCGSEIPSSSLTQPPSVGELGMNDQKLSPQNYCTSDHSAMLAEKSQSQKSFHVVSSSQAGRSMCEEDKADSYLLNKCGEEIPIKGSGELSSNLRTHAQEKPFKCSQCCKAFKSKSELGIHIQVHTGEKPFKCSQCGRSFCDRSAFARHMRAHAGKRPFECSHCGKAISSKTDLSIHMRTHTGERPFECPDCEKCFSDRSAFIRHKRIHSGENPFKCSACGKPFKRSDDLTVHMRNHTGEKPFKCNQCGRAFKKTGELTLHMRSHTGEMPFKCSLCEKAFKKSTRLYLHMRTHTGEKPFKCSQCERSYVQKSSLTSHMRIHAGEFTTQEMPYDMQS